MGTILLQAQASSLGNGVQEVSFYYDECDNENKLLASAYSDPAINIFSRTQFLSGIVLEVPDTASTVHVKATNRECRVCDLSPKNTGYSVTPTPTPTSTPSSTPPAPTPPVPSPMPSSNPCASHTNNFFISTGKGTLGSIGTGVGFCDGTTYSINTPVYSTVSSVSSLTGETLCIGEFSSRTPLTPIEDTYYLINDFSGGTFDGSSSQRYIKVEASTGEILEVGFFECDGGGAPI